jgi:hypothetical protein
MLRPGESRTSPAGESPVRVSDRAPGSRPRPEDESPQAERGVKSLRGGSKSADRSIKRILQPRQIYKEGAESFASRRRPCPISPVRLPPVGKVQQLQRQLWLAAKRSPERRFHALYDRIFRTDVLKEAWDRVRSNRGAAGVDRETLAMVEEYGVERMLQELQGALRAGKYHPSPVRRRGIPKPDGGVRPLGIPTVRDRVVRQATRPVLESISEADFCESSGRNLRAGRSERWTRDWFESLGLYRLRGTIRYPGAA